VLGEEPLAIEPHGRPMASVRPVFSELVPGGLVPTVPGVDGVMPVVPGVVPIVPGDEGLMPVVPEVDGLPGAMADGAVVPLMPLEPLVPAEPLLAPPPAPAASANPALPASSIAAINETA
jgi:hypothetical protein